MLGVRYMELLVQVPLLLLLHLHLHLTSSVVSVPLVSELASYLDNDTVTCFDDDFDIIIWWHEHKLTYLILSILAKDVMSVPVSTVSLESCFSLTGRVIEERR